MTAIRFIPPQQSGHIKSYDGYERITDMVTCDGGKSEAVKWSAPIIQSVIIWGPHGSYTYIVRTMHTVS